MSLDMKALNKVVKEWVDENIRPRLLADAKEAERLAGRALRDAMTGTTIMPSNHVEAPVAAYDAARAKVDEMGKK